MNNLESIALRPTEFVANLIHIMPAGFDPHQQQDVPEVFRTIIDELIHVTFINISGFSISSKNIIQCNVCMDHSSNIQIINMLPVQLAGDVQSCVENFLHPENLPREQGWRCTTCMRQEETTKTAIFQQLPNVLTIQLKRFSLFKPIQFESLLLLSSGSGATHSC